MKAMLQQLTDEIVHVYPQVQAIYLFGSVANSSARADSDVDLAVLLPPDQARQTGNLALSELALQLMKIARRDVDLINLRLAPTTLQVQAIGAHHVLFCGDEFARQEFEMLTLSYFQKLNEERAEIMMRLRETRRVYAV